MKNNEMLIKTIFWVIVCVIVAVCSFFIMHNAAWLLGDDCQTLIYTGWDKPIFGFFVSPELGRFFPLNYTIYNVLCLLYEGQIPPAAHYFIHVICFVVFVFGFILLALNILREKETKYKYLITLMIVILVVGRTYYNFINCWTGAWTIFTFLPLFMYCTVRFFDTNKWWYAIVALLSINYILYYYETMFVIPLTIGITMLLFKFKELNKNHKLYYSLLVASGLLFLLLYAILVLPKVNEFYGHNSSDSLIVNAFKMFYAQKIMWIVLVLIIVRTVDFIKNKFCFTYYDALLLASCAYCCGAAILKLDYTFYYIPAVLIAIPSILYFSNKYVSSKWTLILFICLALFYGRKIPNDIISNQFVRKNTYSAVQEFINISHGSAVYFYECENSNLEDWQKEVRLWRRNCLTYVSAWYMNNKDFQIISKKEFNGESGLWQVVHEDKELFINACPSAKQVLNMGASDIYLVE